MRWDDVNARARGLATHLLTPRDLHELVRARSPDDLQRLLEARGYPGAAEGAESASRFDRHVGDVTAVRFALLGRWLGPRRSALGVIYEVEERQAVRALLRGAVQALSPAGRLHAVTPTPGLPRPQLEALAAAASPADLARRLLALGHPVGRALQVATSEPATQGLLGLEAAVARTYAVRATRAARRGGRILRSFTAWAIDAENAWAVLQADLWGPQAQPQEFWLPGGRVLSPERFVQLAVAPEGARSELASAFAGSPFAAVFSQPPGGEAGFERGLLAAQIAWCRAMARLQPLGPAVVLGVLSRIRAEAHDLRAIAWGLELQAPAAAVSAALAGTG